MASEREQPAPDPEERQEIVVNAYASRPPSGPAEEPSPTSDRTESEPEGKPEPRGDEPGKTSGLSWSSLLICGVLSFLLGGTGAWAYHTFLAKPADSRVGGESEDRLAEKNNTRVTRLDAEFGRLSEQVEKLDKRLDAMPEPAPPPDLKPLEARIAKLDEVSSKFETLSDTLSPLPGRVDENRGRIKAAEDAIDEIRTSLDGLRNEVGAAREREADAKDKDQDQEGKNSSAENPSTPEVKAGDATFEQGANLFRKRQYKEARDLFLRLAKAEPDDARVWYYAALSNGFATGQWRGETERLVRQGVERERAKTPPRFMIDAAFENLDKESGRDWLDAYRRMSY